MPDEDYQRGYRAGYEAAHAAIAGMVLAVQADALSAAVERVAGFAPDAVAGLSEAVAIVSDCAQAHDPVVYGTKGTKITAQVTPPDEDNTDEEATDGA